MSMVSDNPPIEQVEFAHEDNTTHSLSDALSWIRGQSATKRNRYKSKWTEDGSIRGHCGVDGEGDGANVERRNSLHVRTAADASIYSRGSEILFDHTLSATGQLQRAGCLLRGSSHAEPDLPANTDAVDRLRAKLDRLSKDRCPESMTMHSPIGSATADRSNTAPGTLRRCSRALSSPSSTASSVTESLLLQSRPTSRASDVIGSCVKPRYGKAAGSNTIRKSLPSAIDYSPDNRRPLPTVCVFDPDRMQGSQRSAKKAAKRVKDEIAAKAEARRRRLFKARPLPWGDTVKSEIFAPTKTTTAAPSSRPGTCHSVASFASPPPQSLSGNHCNCMSDNTSKSSQGRRSPLKRTPKRNTARRRKLMEEIDSRIHSEMNGAIVPYDPDLADDNDDMSIESDGSDMQTLLQQIGRLGAQLKQRQSACESTLDEIEALDNLDNIDHIDLSDVPNNRSTSRTSSTPLAIAISPLCSPEYGAASPAEIGSCTTQPTAQAHRDSLYRRQEKWVSALEKKLDDARLEKADEIMSSITGKPRFVSTGDSWQKAKAAHDAAARRARQDHERRMKNEDAREAIIIEQKLQATKQAELEATKAQQEINKQIIVDKKRQTEYAERLARPRRIVAISPSTSSVQKQQGNEMGKGHVGTSCEFGKGEGLNYTSTSSLPLHNPSGGSVDPPEVPDSSSTPGQKSNNKSFADMDDNEFANVMRRLGIKSVPKAKEGKAKKKKGPFSSSKRRRWHPGDPMNKMHLDSYHRTPTKSHSDKGSRPNASAGAKANPGTKSEPKGRYVSSEAQASLMKKMSALMDAKSGTNNTIGSRPLKITATAKLSIDKNSDAAGAGITTCTDNTTTCPPVSSAIKDGGPSSTVVPVATTIDHTFMEPYERYEAGQEPFFDKSSSDERGRFRVRDASSFIPDSMRRMAGPHSNTDDGIMLLVGRKNGEAGEGECAITILFDRKKFSEDDAIRWWETERQRFSD